MNQEKTEQALTGRIQESPSLLLHEEVLQPQFAYELEHLLPHYIQIEKAMVSEYARMGLVTEPAAREVSALLDEIDRDTLTADPRANMSDICFAIERYVETRLTHRSSAWHADRSRNDVQATAQVMFARERLLSVSDDMLTFAEAVQMLAERTAALPMPGYTHYQPAQILTAGYYMAAVNEQLGKTISRLQNLYEEMNECPLGAGAMAGLELGWDREALAAQLGFARPCRHALVSVASKEWMLQIGAELSTASVTLSRFVTDLITWGSSEYGFIDLPDQMSGISSAMPQKKNFPILERIRGKTAHLTAYYLDFATAQRNTPFTNLVETAKEGGSNFEAMIRNMKTLLKLFTTAMTHLQFREQRMREVCAREFFGGFTLANLLSLRGDIPYRQAQVLAGQYVLGMMERGRQPSDADAALMQGIAAVRGFDVCVSDDELRQAFDVEHNLYNKRTLGSTHPDQVLALLAMQQREREVQRTRWQQAVRGVQSV